MFPVGKYWNLFRVNWNFCLRYTFAYKDLIQIWMYTIILFSSFMFYIILIFHFSLFLLPRGTREEFWQLTISHMTCDGSFCLNLLCVLTMEITCHNPLFPRDLRACMNSSQMNCDFQVIKCSEKNYWKGEVVV